MDKNTMIFLVILLLIICVVGFLIYRNNEKNKVANANDAKIAMWGSIGGMGSSLIGLFGNLFGKKK